MSDTTFLSFEHHIEAKFRLDNLRELFEPPGDCATSVARTVRIPGAGWSIRFETKKDGLDIGAFLENPYNVHVPVTFSLRVDTLDETRCLLERTTQSPSRQATPCSGWGWSALLPRSQFWAPAKAKTCLRHDNAVLITVKISGKPYPHKTPNSVTNVLYRRLTEQINTSVRAFAFASRGPGGLLRDVHEYRLDVDVVKQSCNCMCELLSGHSRNKTLMEMDEHFRSCRLEGLHTDYVDEDSDYEDEQPSANAVAQKSPTKQSVLDFESERKILDLENKRAPVGQPSQETQLTSDDACEAGTVAQRAQSLRESTKEVERSPDVWSLDDEKASPAFSDVDGDWKMDDLNPNGVFTKESSKLVEEQKLTEVGEEIPKTADDDKMVPRHEETGKPMETSEVSNTLENVLRSPPDSGQAVIVTGIAAKTWEALIFYMYTGTITFAPLKSEGKDAYTKFVKEYCEYSADRPTPCSCKSMYRVAKEIGLKDLQNLALDHVKQRLTAANIIAEIYSKFTSEHREVLDLELSVLVKHWKDIKNTPIFKDKVRQVCSDKSTHGGEVILEILQRVGSLSL